MRGEIVICSCTGLPAVNQRSWSYSGYGLTTTPLASRQVREELYAANDPARLPWVIHVAVPSAATSYSDVMMSMLVPELAAVMVALIGPASVAPFLNAGVVYVSDDICGGANCRVSLPRAFGAAVDNTPGALR